MGTAAEFPNHLRDRVIVIIADSFDQAQGSLKPAWGDQLSWFKDIGVKRLLKGSAIEWHGIGETKNFGPPHLLSWSIVLVMRALRCDKIGKYVLIVTVCGFKSIYGPAGLTGFTIFVNQDAFMACRKLVVAVVRSFVKFLLVGLRSAHASFQGNLTMRA